MAKEGCFNEDLARFYAVQVAVALGHLHDNKIIYRDLKPENLLITSRGLKIADFGWSAHSPSDRRKTFCGTLDYLPPEMVYGEEYGKSTDIWSVGVLAFELLTGNPPFFSNDQQETKALIADCEKKLTLPAYLSDAAVDFIKGLLKNEGSLRPSLTSIEKHPWL